MRPPGQTHQALGVSGWIPPTSETPVGEHKDFHQIASESLLPGFQLQWNRRLCSSLPRCRRPPRCRSRVRLPAGPPNCHLSSSHDQYGFEGPLVPWAVVHSPFSIAFQLPDPKRSWWKSEKARDHLLQHCIVTQYSRNDRARCRSRRCARPRLNARPAKSRRQRRSDRARTAARLCIGESPKSPQGLCL
jgi:hypothetical protein